MEKRMNRNDVVISSPSKESLEEIIEVLMYFDEGDNKGIDTSVMCKFFNKQPFEGRIWRFNAKINTADCYYYITANVSIKGMSLRLRNKKLEHLLTAPGNSIAVTSYADYEEKDA